MRKLVRECEVRPNWYAFSYFDHCRNFGVFYPVGIHWIVKLFKRFEYWLHRVDKEWWDEREEAIGQRWRAYFLSMMPRWREETYNEEFESRVRLEIDRRIRIASKEYLDEQNAKIEELRSKEVERAK